MNGHVERQSAAFRHTGEGGRALAPRLNTPAEKGFLGADLGPGLTRLLSDALH